MSTAFNSSKENDPLEALVNKESTESDVALSSTVDRMPFRWSKPKPQSVSGFKMNNHTLGLHNIAVTHVGVDGRLKFIVLHEGYAQVFTIVGTNSAGGV